MGVTDQENLSTISDNEADQYLDYVYHEEGSGDDNHHHHEHDHNHHLDDGNEHHHDENHEHHHHHDNEVKVQFPDLTSDHLGLEVTRSDLSEAERSFVDQVSRLSSRIP